MGRTLDANSKSLLLPSAVESCVYIFAPKN